MTSAGRTVRQVIEDWQRNEAPKVRAIIEDYQRNEAPRVREILRSSEHRVRSIVENSARKFR